MSSETPSSTWNWIAHLCALAVAGVFVYAASSKIAQPRQFVIDINNYHVLPTQYTNIFAILLPWWEVAAALALIVPRTRRAGALLTGAMLVMFIAAVAVAMKNGYDISCGCFGKGSGAAGWQTIGLDVGLLVATAIAFLVPPRAARTAGFPVMPSESPAPSEKPA